ncbi:hypothetical protein DXV75_16265 [Alteromonas aestuariivivens]|uniref:Uncharacterized protein n=1 Tax=Alteromonas aestuariivivens TaxID=1938339 RepID=A0A3D8M2S4_9ALTE|nr:hypothetical protein [Alteromonas aestuariivivens]RDV24013.1 hypothetical protein DXV75_16265 [Alteromonas aestuariivivens]
MKSKSLIAAALLSAAFSSQVFAQESSVERVLSQFITHAVTTTGYELKMGVRQAIANTAHAFDPQQNTRSGTVTVTDLATALQSADESTSAEHNVTSGD